jgi:outer membrane protein assembly factor BamA
MIDKNPVICVVEGKLCINGIVFEHNELRESKEYLQSMDAEEAFFSPEDEEELNELHEIVKKMEENYSF